MGDTGFGFCLQHQKKRTFILWGLETWKIQKMGPACLPNGFGPTGKLGGGQPNL